MTQLYSQYHFVYIYIIIYTISFIGNCLETIKLLVFSTIHRFALSEGPHAIVIETYTEFKGYEIENANFWSSAAMNYNCT